jgi:hypothetical protein
LRKRQPHHIRKAKINQFQIVYFSNPIAHPFLTHRPAVAGAGIILNSST